TPNTPLVPYTTLFRSPVDFSEPSGYALEVAATLAKKYNAEIVALHMMGLTEAVVTREENKEIFEAIYYMKLAEKRFAEFLDKDLDRKSTRLNSSHVKI